MHVCVYKAGNHAPTLQIGYRSNLLFPRCGHRVLLAGPEDFSVLHDHGVCIRMLGIRSEYFSIYKKMFHAIMHSFYTFDGKLAIFIGKIFAKKTCKFIKKVVI